MALVKMYDALYAANAFPHDAPVACYYPHDPRSSAPPNVGPGTTVLTIDNHGGHPACHILDVESGAATFASVPSWLAEHKRLTGRQGTVYVAAGNHSQVPGGEPYYWWAAQWDRNPVLVPGSVAHQYASDGMLGKPYDLSVADTGWLDAITGKAPPPQPPATGATADQLIAEAVIHLGYHEGTTTPFGEWYAGLPGHGPGFAGAAWCDMFVSYCAAHSGTGDVVGCFAYVPYHENWFRGRGIWHQGAAGIQRGDIVVYEWESDQTPDHIGIVESADASGLVHAIEGNTGTPDGVYRMTRAPSVIAGYGRPVYAPDPAPAPEPVPDKPVPRPDQPQMLVTGGYTSFRAAMHYHSMTVQEGLWLMAAQQPGGYRPAQAAYIDAGDWNAHMPEGMDFWVGPTP